MEEQASAVMKSPFADIEKFCAMLLDARKDGKRIFFAGNGGSAATASHFTNDLVKGLSPGNVKRFRAFSLVDQVPVITALANDYDYSVIFSEQLKNYGEKDDLLIVISGSGNSPNVLKACETAAEMGIKTISMTGRDGGRLRDLCDLSVIAPVHDMERIEDIHMLWEHCIICALRQVIDGEV
ncbi:MAG: SIS domain-containing protein [Clostridia bacterium]|nr:SIS domain-containing protein [Clostridia bacterium]